MDSNNGHTLQKKETDENSKWEIGTKSYQISVLRSCTTTTTTSNKTNKSTNKNLKERTQNELKEVCTQL